MHEKIRYFSLFSGIGGFELGIQKADDNKCPHISKESEQEERKERWKRITEEREVLLCSGESTPLCVGYSEVNKYAIQTYQRHFPEHRNYGDATKIKTESLPDFDMLCGGFPCQSFSIAGKRKGFQDIRGTLFFEIYRIAKAKKPRLLFLENVKGLLSADDGRCFGTIISSLDELGYDVEWQVLNSKNFGVPQNRERVFIIGHLRGAGGQAVFPLGESSSEYAKELIYEGAIMSEQNKRWLEDGKELSRNFPQGQRVYSPDGIAPNICGDAGGLGGKTGLFMINAHQWRTGEYGNGIKYDASFTLDSGSGRDYCVINPSVRSGGRGSLDRHKWDIVEQKNNIRRLTPTECERLQGFPDGWTEGVSDTQRYKQLGNAVTVNVIQAIAENLPCSFHGMDKKQKG